ncbi:hypothetical protein CFT12S02263_01560 [Campylobacter fetus subsp. testudinum]|nr:hypothetical protein CFT12S02263_01560 [Campylobacter fetus subsp. testudinum]
MPVKNKHICPPRISKCKFREILNCFCLDIGALKVSGICSVLRNSTNKIFKQKKSEAKFANKDIAIIKGGIFIFYYSYERSKIVVLPNLIGGVLSCFGSNLIQKSSF